MHAFLAQLRLLSTDLAEHMHKYITESSRLLVGCDSMLLPLKYDLSTYYTYYFSQTMSNMFQDQILVAKFNKIDATEFNPGHAENIDRDGKRPVRRHSLCNFLPRSKVSPACLTSLKLVAGLTCLTSLLD